MPGYVSNTLLTSDALNAPLGTVRSAVKYNDFPVTNLAAYRDDPELLIPVPANTIWALKSSLLYLSTTATGDEKFNISSPSGTTGMVCPFGYGVAAVAGEGAQLNMGALFVNNPGFDDLAVGGISSANYRRCSPMGWVKTSTTPGNIGVRFAQNTAEASTATLAAGSWMMLIRIG